MTLEDRFWEKVDVRGENECWEWTGGKRAGYGRMRKGRKQVGAHCVSWEIHNGELPAGFQALHDCDNPGCVNPGHLFLGTHGDNMADRNTKGRSAKGEGHGRAKITKEQVIAIRRRYAVGGVTQTQLGEYYGLGQGAVHYIVSGKSWAHVREGLS